MDEISQEILLEDLKDQQDLIEKAINMAVQHAGRDGDRHKAWCIDQMVRILSEGRYESIVKKCLDNGYDWDVGIFHDK